MESRMSLYIDSLFLNQIAYRLDKFTRKGDNLYNCRCPFCGDSKKNLNKARGFFFKHKDRLNFKCHNCGKSTTFSALLKKIDPIVYKSYVKEGYASKNIKTEIVSRPKSKKRNELENRIDVQWPFLQPLFTLPKNHDAIKYLSERKIPEQFFSLFYFVEQTKLLNGISERYEGRWKTDEPRIVIPFYDIDKKLVGFNCRALDKTVSMRYCMVKINEEAELIFGIERVDFSKDAFIVEGPFDSLFLDNAVAAGGTDLDRAIPYFDENKVTIVFDNQPRNKDVVKLVARSISKGCRVCIWPSEVEEKDINEMILNGKSSDDIQHMIIARSFRGLTAKVKFNEWRKTE